MSRKVAAIFDCREVPSDRSDSVSLEATYDAEEWQEFTEATPWGHIEMGLSPDAPARDFFHRGATYRVTFEEVED